MAKKSSKYRNLVANRLTRVRGVLMRNAPKNTVRAFAKRIGVPEKTYEKWESGDNLIPQEIAAGLEDSDGVSLSYLYSRDPKRLEPEFLFVRRA